MTATATSRLHRLASDELWVFQGGLPLEVVAFTPGGELTRRVLGDPAEGEAGAQGAPQVPGAPEPRAPEPQVLVPAGSWQGARLAGGPHLPASRAWALASCIVTPGFDYEDFELGERAELLARYPLHAAIVEAFT